MILAIGPMRHVRQVFQSSRLFQPWPAGAKPGDVERSWLDATPRLLSVGLQNVTSCGDYAHFREALALVMPN